MKNNLPQHMAIIPDGNRRWADTKGVPHIQGHELGAERMYQTVEQLMHQRIKFLTIWGFSTDNWKRKEEEVQSLFHLFQLWIERETSWAQSNGVRLRHIGRLHELPQSLQEAINQAIALTHSNMGMTLNVAFNYSGRTEIIDAVRRLIADQVPREAVDEHLFSRYLYTDGMPNVDLVIRTAGALHLSNFMLWQTACSAGYFTPVLWPDFDKLELEKALEAYSRRQKHLVKTNNFFVTAFTKDDLCFH